MEEGLSVDETSGKEARRGEDRPSRRLDATALAAEMLGELYQPRLRRLLWVLGGLEVQRALAKIGALDKLG